jgi:hypothetical protein
VPGTPGAPYGRQPIEIYVSELNNAEPQLIVATRVAHDGVGLTPSNLSAQWLKTNVIEFWLSGLQEQEETVLIVDIDQSSYIERAEACKKQ